MNCPRCNSIRLHYHGHTEAKSDRYRCADCKKTFTPDKKPGNPGRKRIYASDAEKMREWRARQKFNVKNK